MPENNNESEPSEFELISPAKIEITRETSAQEPSESTEQPPQVQQTRNWIWPTLAGLVVVTFAVFFLLPGLVPEPQVEIGTDPANSAIPTARQGEPGRREAESSPWQEALAARERKSAQDILAQLLDVQFELEEQRVELWAEQEFSQIKDLAQQGDEAYRERLFEQATGLYQRAFDGSSALLASLPGVLERTLAQGLESLEQGDVAGAKATFSLVLEVEPLNPEGVKGLERANKLEQVLALVKQAESDEQAGNLDEALVVGRQALELDADTASAQRLVERVSGEIVERDYTAAMSAGYRALEGARYDAAKKSFSQALKLKPGATEARDGLEEAGLRVTRNIIGGHRKKAEKLESQEQWLQAQQRYEQVLKLDNSVIFAQEGLKRTAARAKLDGLLVERLENPARLSDEEVYQETIKLARVARTVASPGPRLSGQIKQLEAVLKSARIPLTVELKSDDMTDVTLYRIGHLGNFLNQQVSLVPGKYVLTGKRSGYRDVRKEFAIVAGTSPEPVIIKCVEKI